MPSLLNANEVKCTLIYDIECVPIVETFEELQEHNPQLAEGWHAEALNIRKNRKTLESDNMTDGELFEEYGGLYPEYAKVIAISAGVIDIGEEETKFYIRNYSNHDEEQLLRNFWLFLDKVEEKKQGFVMGGYNIKIYDNPMLAKRMVINGMGIHKKLYHVNKKPWEINDVDLAEKWQLGKFDKLVKFDIMCGALDIESPKGNMDGSDVAEFYYNEENGLEMISEYCYSDTVATAEMFLKLSGLYEGRGMEVVEF